MARGWRGVDAREAEERRRDKGEDRVMYSGKCSLKTMSSYKRSLLLSETRNAGGWSAIIRIQLRVHTAIQRMAG